MNFSQKVYLVIKNSKKKVVTEEFLQKTMQLRSGFDMQALRGALAELVKQDKIVKTARGKYMLAQYSSFIRAKMSITRAGYGFARPENGDEDVFIAERNLNGALHGDIVLISRAPVQNKRQNNQASGYVEKILARGYEQIVGLVSINNGVVLVVPDEKRFADSIFIAPTDTMGAQQNSKVVVKILEYPTRTKMAIGKIIEVLGDSKDIKVTTLSIIRSFNLIETFPEEVEAEAKAVALPIGDKEKIGRKDFTKDLVITIDGEDARDFDDAISLTKKNDKYYLHVHIADVSHYVKEGGKIDKEAFDRGTSVYFPDYVLPMLPTSLSNGMCSLNPNEDRLTTSVEIVFDNDAKILNYNICKGIIHSAYRMTYTNVTKILNKDVQMCEKYSKIVPMLSDMAALAEKLIERRDKAGQLDFDIAETQVVVDENYRTVDIVKKPRELSHRLIEQFMVVTNEVVAKHFDQLNLPFVYRVHEDPTPEKITNFMGFAQTLGLKMNKSATPKDFQKLLIESKDKTYSSALSKIMLRSMQKARYSSEDLGHFGLALKHYCHFTSPIRRYPDLIIHRIISYYLDGSLTDKKLSELQEFVEVSAMQSSTTERNAEQAERAVDDQKKAEFMVDKIGNVYRSIVSGVSDSGIYVELDNTVEGLIYTENLPHDRYIFDQKKFAMVGKHHMFRIGDSIVVKVAAVDVVTRHIDFVIASPEEQNALNDNK